MVDSLASSNRIRPPNLQRAFAQYSNLGTGIGEVKGSKDLELALTTVGVPAGKFGSRAAATIALAITEPETPIVSQMFAPELIIRGT